MNGNEHMKNSTKAVSESYVNDVWMSAWKWNGGKWSQRC